MRNDAQPADFSVLYTVVTISCSTWGYATRFILQGKICVCKLLMFSDYIIWKIYDVFWRHYSNWRYEKDKIKFTTQGDN